MKERDLIRDETKLVFYRLDPFPKDITITVSKESGEAAVATIVVALPDVKAGGPSSDWKLDENIGQIYLRPLVFTANATVVPMKKCSWNCCARISCSATGKKTCSWISTATGARTRRPCPKD